MDPEYSILKHRLEQHMIKSGIGHKGIQLDKLTKIAEQAITNARSPTSLISSFPHRQAAAHIELLCVAGSGEAHHGDCGRSQG